MVELKLCTVLALLLTGCTSFDPWKERTRTPSAPSNAYVPRSDPSRDQDVQESRPTQVSPSLPQEARGKRLTLAECLVIGLGRSPETRRSWQETRSAAARIGEEKAAYLPTVGFSATAGRGSTPEDRALGDKSRDEFSAGFGVRYLLFDGGLRPARVRGAEAELLAANFRHNTTLQDVALAVELAYQERLASQALVRVAQEAVRQRQYQLELARARLRSGVAAKFDVLKAETEKADADLDLVRARSVLRIAQGRLARVMGLRVTETFEIEDLPEDVRQTELADIDAMLKEASVNRPELREARAQIDANRAIVSAVQAEYFPTLSAGADYG